MIEYSLEDLKKVKEELETQEAFLDEENDQMMKTIYFGDIRSLTPSGKYYLPFACSNVTEEEAIKDGQYWKRLENKVHHLGMFLISGEGDPLDVIIGMAIEEEKFICPHCGSDKGTNNIIKVIFCSNCKAIIWDRFTKEKS